MWAKCVRILTHILFCVTIDIKVRILWSRLWLFFVFGLRLKANDLIDIYIYKCVSLSVRLFSARKFFSIFSLNQLLLKKRPLILIRSVLKRSSPSLRPTECSPVRLGFWQMVFSLKHIIMTKKLYSTSFFQQVFHQLFHSWQSGSERTLFSGLSFHQCLCPSLACAIICGVLWAQHSTASCFALNGGRYQKFLLFFILVNVLELSETWRTRSIRAASLWPHFGHGFRECTRVCTASAQAVAMLQICWDGDERLSSGGVCAHWLWPVALMCNKFII